MIRPTSTVYKSTRLVHKIKTISQNIIHNPELVNITVYNASGAKVMSSSLSAINAGSLPQGVDIIRAEDGSSLKFIR